MGRFIAIIALLSSSFVFGKGISFKDTKLSADLGFAGNYVDDKQVEARIFGVKANLYIDQKFSETVSGKLGAGASLETGSNNSLVIDEYAPERKWILKEGYLNWAPFNFLNLKAGAINQKVYNSPLLLTRTAFLAAEEKLTLELSEEHIFYLRMQQAIPNNQNLASRIGTVDEGTPAFYAETVGMDLQGDILAVKAEVSQWAFNKLSNGVAYSSRFSGNTITGSGQLNSAFAYKFKGYNVLIDSSFNFTDLIGFKFVGQYLYNDKAPDNRNTGRIVQLGLRLGDYTFIGENFENQSDSSPAYYNSKTYGHNNKEGNRFGLEGDFEEDKLGFKLWYLKMSPITNNIFQSDTTVFYASIKKELDF